MKFIQNQNHQIIGQHGAQNVMTVIILMQRKQYNNYYLI